MLLTGQCYWSCLYIAPYFEGIIILAGNKILTEN